MNEEIKKVGLEGFEDTFRVGKSSAPSSGAPLSGVDESAPIILNISSVAIPQKLAEIERLKGARYTGNPIVDFYYKINDYLIAHSRVKTSEKASFFRLLSVMVNAGVPLVKSLDILSEQNIKNLKFGRVIYDLARKVEEGKSLSDTMKLHNDVFDEAQIGMVKSGEASGQMVKTLSNVATNLEKNAALKSKIKGAMIYPTVVICILVAVVFAVMIFVIPKMKDFFSQMGEDLPSITKVVIAVSDAFVDYWFIIIGGLVGLAALFNIWKKTEHGKYLWDNFVLKVPLIGGLIRKTILAQFTKSFSDLIGAGIPLINALKITANSLGNSVYKEKIMMAAKDVEQGIPLAETLNDPKLIPTMLMNMIAVGEQTAQLETVTERVSMFYEEEVDEMVKGLMKAFEPAIIVMIGAIVGVTVAAIMLPIMQMSTGVEGM